MMEEQADTIIQNFTKWKKFLDIIRKPLRKSRTQAIFIAIRANILLISFEKLKDNPKLLEQLEEEFSDIEEAYKGLRNCELCFYHLFEEIEKLNKFIKE